jgi:hypothetical protein
VAPLGAVDIPPSRESLEFTEKTKCYIRGILESIRGEYKITFEADLLKKTSFLEAWNYVADANRRLVNYQQDDVLKYNGGKSNASYYQLARTSVQLEGGYSYVGYDRSLKSRWSNCGQYVQRFTLQDPDVQWYVDDLGRGSVALLRDDYAKFTKYSDVKLIKLGITSTNKRALLDPAADVAIKVLKKQLGITVKKASSVLGFPVIAKSGTGKRVEADQVFNCVQPKAFNRSLKPFKQPYTETDLPDSGYYVELHGSTLVGMDYAELYTYLRYLASLSTPVPVYLIRRKTLGKLDAKVLPLKSVRPSAKAYFETMEKERSVRAQVSQMIPYEILGVLERLPGLTRGDHKAALLARFYGSHRKASVAANSWDANQALTNLGISKNTGTVPYKKKLETLVTHVKKEYNALSTFTENCWRSGPAIDNLVEILKMYDSKTVTPVTPVNSVNP